MTPLNMEELRVRPLAYGDVAEAYAALAADERGTAAPDDGALAGSTRYVPA